MTIDLTATDGGANSFFGQQGYAGVGDLTWRFFGTSAAAPHAAAVAALIRQCHPALSPAGVLQAMTSSAVPIGSLGPDAVGTGLVDAAAALTAAGPERCPPGVTVTVPGPPASGWFTTAPVTGTVSASDTSLVTSLACSGATVGVASGTGSATATAPIAISAQGISHVSCTASDGRSNSGAAPGSRSSATVKIDSVAPTVAVGGVRAGATYQYAAVPVATCPTSDTTSGVAAASVRSLTGPVRGLGTFTVGCSSASDNAGNIRAGLAGAYRVLAATTGAVLPRTGSTFKRGKVVAVGLPLTGATRLLLPDATSAWLASTRGLRVVLHARTATGPTSAVAPCSYSRSTHRVACSLRLAAGLPAGTYWVDVQENLGWGFLSVPRAARSTAPNPVRIVVTR